MTVHRVGGVALALLLAAALSCAEGKKNKVPDDVKAALDKADTFELYSLDPGKGEAVKDGFHGWKVLGKTTVKDADTRKQIVAALAKGAEENDGRAAKCFEPRHGIRVIRDGKTTDLVICFACLQVRTYQGDKDGAGFLTTASPQATFDKMLKAADVPLAPKPKPDGK